MCVNTGGYPRGIEIYQGKAIVYGQPGLYLQNEQFTRVPSSAMPLLGMSSDSSAGEFYDERIRMVTAVGGSDVPGLNPELGPPGVSSVGQVAFNEDNEITEIRVQPFEFLTEPRYRHGFPFLSKPGSTAAKALLDFMATRCAPFGTAFENEDRVRVVRVV